MPDEPEIGRDELISNQMIDSYTQALGTWKTAEDINMWVGGSFTYDRTRAIKLSSDRKNREKGISIYKPSEFFITKAGVSVRILQKKEETKISERKKNKKSQQSKCSRSQITAAVDFRR
ncbi:MAG: hypothetical protein PF690_10350 [Deltaproteobacteria bacterium]|nr:hypothetical protein [Deltaproteobacteria bacterium]